MNYFLVTFDEIFLKSENVSKKLLNFLEKQLRKKGIENIKKKRFKFLIPYNEENYNKIKEILLKTFGIKKIYEVLEFSSYEKLLNFLKNINLESKSFKVITKRLDKSFPKNSLEISKEIGSILVKKGLKVDLKNPEKVIYIEVDDKFYLSLNFYYGLGGLPLGSQGKTLSLFSGGIDSPVATFLIAKRGIKPYLFYVYNGNPIVLFKTFLVFKKINEFLNTRFFYFSLTLNLLKEIKKAKSGYKQIVYKYFLYKLSEKFAEKLGLFSITTGENLSQVSTQTQNSLYLLNLSINKLINRPLLTFDKEEIKIIAKNIGTLELSELIDEICMIEKRSVPFPKKKDFFDEINKLDFNFDDLIREIKEFNEKKEKELVNIIRKFEEVKNNKVIFLEKEKDLDKKVEKLLKSREEFVLVCEKGIKSWYFLVKMSKQLNIDLREIKSFAFACSYKDLKVNLFKKYKNLF